MRTVVSWQEQIPMPPPEANQTNQVWTVCFRPDGTQILVGVADFIFISNALTGEFMNKIKGMFSISQISSLFSIQVTRILFIVSHIQKTVKDLLLEEQTTPL